MDNSNKCLKCDRIFKTKSGLTLHMRRCGTVIEETAPAIPKAPHAGPYNYIGDPIDPEKQKGVFELVVADFLRPIIPANYFITSGEAVTKAEVLEKDLWKMAGQARQFVAILKEYRGAAMRLECGWSGNGLLAKPKNPRLRGPAVIKEDPLTPTL